MGWYETKEQRKKNRQHEDWRAGHKRRQGFSALVDKKSGDVIGVAVNGCFGRLHELDPDLYQEWAQGTRGAFGR